MSDTKPEPLRTVYEITIGADEYRCVKSAAITTTARYEVFLAGEHQGTLSVPWTDIAIGQFELLLRKALESALDAGAWATPL